MQLTTFQLTQRQRVDARRVAPNPQHPRGDWQTHDEDLQRLAYSLQDQGQLTAAVATPTEEGDGLYEQGFEWVLIKGHRRRAAALLAGLPLEIEVVTDEEGLPLAPYLQLSRWLTLSSAKPPEPEHILLCLARMRHEWAILEEELGDDAPAFPSLSQIAEAHSLSKSTVHRYLRICEMDPEIVSAVAEGQVQPTAVLALLKEQELTDAQRLQLTRDLIAANLKGELESAGPVTVDTFRAWIRQELDAPFAPGRVDAMGRADRGGDLGLAATVGADEEDEEDEEGERILFIDDREPDVMDDLVERLPEPVTFTTGRLTSPMTLAAPAGAGAPPPPGSAIPAYVTDFQSLMALRTLGARTSHPSTVQLLAACLLDVLTLYEQVIFQDQGLPPAVTAALDAVSRHRDLDELLRELLDAERFPRDAA